MPSLPQEILETIASNLHGKDKVRYLASPFTNKREQSSSGVRARSGLRVPAGQPGTVLQIHSAYPVHGPCERQA